MGSNLHLISEAKHVKWEVNDKDNVWTLNILFWYKILNSNYVFVIHLQWNILRAMWNTFEISGDLTVQLKRYVTNSKNKNFSGTIPEWSQGFVIWQPTTEFLEDPRRVHLGKCVPDWCPQIKMGGSECHLQHDSGLPPDLFHHDQS